jgi:nucleoid-associated protein YgaU
VTEAPEAAPVAEETVTAEAPVAPTDSEPLADFAGATDDATPPPSLFDSKSDTVNARLDDIAPSSLEPAPVAAVPDVDELVKEPAPQAKTDVVTKIASIPKEPALEKTVDGDEGEYVVAAGDSLGIISSRIYGTSKKWQELAEANDLKAPFFIFPGDVLKFKVSTPKAKKFVAGVKESLKTVVVEKGDTLAKIAEKIYGDKDAWKKFMVYNRPKIGNPNKIFVGMKLTYLPRAKVVSEDLKAMPRSDSGPK